MNEVVITVSEAQIEEMVNQVKTLRDKVESVRDSAEFGNPTAVHHYTAFVNQEFALLQVLRTLGLHDLVVERASVLV